MSSSLEDLFQDIFRHPRVETADVKSSLVWLRGCTTHISACAGGGNHVSRHRRGDRGRNRVGVLGDNHGWARRRRHVGGIGLAISLRCIVLLVRASIRGLRLMGGRRRSRHVIRHCCGGELRSTGSWSKVTVETHRGDSSGWLSDKENI